MTTNLLTKTSFVAMLMQLWNSTNPSNSPVTSSRALHTLYCPCPLCSVAFFLASMHFNKRTFFNSLQHAIWGPNVLLSFYSSPNAKSPTTQGQSFSASVKNKNRLHLIITLFHRQDIVVGSQLSTPPSLLSLDQMRVLYRGGLDSNMEQKKNAAPMVTF